MQNFTRSLTSRRKMMQLRPVSAIANLHRRPVNCVKVDIVLAHELIEIDILGVEPPLLPFRRIVRSDTGVTNRSIELCGGTSQ